MSFENRHGIRDTERAARILTSPNRPLFQMCPTNFQQVLALAFSASWAGPVRTEWGVRLPQPEVSLDLLERVSARSVAIAQLSLRITVDDLYGCWSLPLTAETDAGGRARYPNVADPNNGSKTTLAHRYVWRTLVDPVVQSTEHLDHLCRTHACCNPTHLDPVIIGVNTKRGVDARHIISGQPLMFHD